MKEKVKWKAETVEIDGNSYSIKKMSASQAFAQQT